MKTILVLAYLTIAFGDVQNVKTIDHSVRPLLKPSGQPLHIDSDVPTLTASKPPQVEYISVSDENISPELVGPQIDYISTPVEVAKPSFEYINNRPESYEYINSYPNYGYNPYFVKSYPSYSFGYNYPTIAQRGYKTAYQFIRNIKPTVHHQQTSFIRSYPTLGQSSSYYPFNNGLQYEYRYPQYLPSLHIPSYLPTIPYRK